MAEYRVAYDNGGKTDNYRAPTHIDIRKALVLREKRTGKSNETVGKHKTENFIEVCVDTLRVAHIDVTARCAQGATHFRTEEEVKKNDNYSNEADERHNGGACAKLCNDNFDIASVYAEVCFTEYFKVHRPEHKLCKYARKYGGNAENSVDKTRYKTREHTCDRSYYERDPDIDTVRCEYSTNAGTRADRAVYRKVGNIENFICNVNAYSHYTPDKTLRYSAGHRP
jgi:hypothetical protein